MLPHNTISYSRRIQTRQVSILKKKPEIICKDLQITRKELFLLFIILQVIKR